MRSAVEAKPVIAVSPIIGGKTVKGPAAKMYAELGIQPSALAVAEHYRGLLSGFVLDNVDAELANLIDDSDANHRYTYEFLNKTCTTWHKMCYTLLGD